MHPSIRSIGRLSLALTALLSGSPGQAAPTDRAVVRLDADGALVLRIDTEECTVRLLGVGPIEGPSRGPAERRLIGPVSVVVRPDQAADDQGVPLVELFRHGQSLNETVVEDGLARLDPIAVVPPRLRERLQGAETRASVGRRGLWADPPRRGPVPAPSTIPAARLPLSTAAEPAPASAPTPASPPTLPRTEPRGAPAAVALGGWLLRWLAWPDPEDADAWIAWVLERAVLAILGIWIASQKRRRPIEGMLLGGGLGIVGILVESCLPSSTAIARMAAPSRRVARSSIRPRRRSALAAEPPRAIVASRPPSPLAEFVAATSSGSLAPISRKSGGGEAVATSVGGLNSVDLVIRTGASHWDDEPPLPAQPPSPFWSEWDYSDCPDQPSEGPSTLSHRPGDSQLISISRDEIESATTRDAG